MFIIRKTLIAAAALAITPAFALAQTSVETAKAPATFMSPQASQPSAIASGSAATASKTQVAHVHKSKSHLRQAAKAKSSKSARLSKSAKTAKLAKTSKAASTAKPAVTTTK
jgi:hypothetical protein